MDMRGGKLLLREPEEDLSNDQASEENLIVANYNKKIKIWLILLLLFISISLVTNMLATKNQPTAEERFVCVSLGFDYYEPGDWDCREIRDDYESYKVQILISNLAFFPIGISLVSILVNLKRKNSHKRNQSSGFHFQN